MKNNYSNTAGNAGRGASFNNDRGGNRSGGYNNDRSGNRNGGYNNNRSGGFGAAKPAHRETVTVMATVLRLLGKRAVYTADDIGSGKSGEVYSFSDDFFKDGGILPKDRVKCKCHTEKDRYTGKPVLIADEVVLVEKYGGFYTGRCFFSDENAEYFVISGEFGKTHLFVGLPKSEDEFGHAEYVKFNFERKHDRCIPCILHSYGSVEDARNCVEAHLDGAGIVADFPADVEAEAETFESRRITKAETAARLDLRDLPIFTIDGADTKDIDDAVYVEKIENHDNAGAAYKLSVHIADVSHYVHSHTAIGKEAYRRGTSVYVADKVIPMLPKSLSNGVCSLNPKVSRLALSCLMTFRADGEPLSYEFRKTVIKSRVKGVYSEINLIVQSHLDGTPDSVSAELREKYADVIEQLPLMKELADLLHKKREAKFALEFNSTECKIVTDDVGRCVDLVARKQGLSEAIIEEFMVLANNAAAALSQREKLPFLYRVHDAPDGDKIEKLSETLSHLGIKGFLAGTARPHDKDTHKKTIFDVVKQVVNTPLEYVVNNAVLRSQMKAKYSHLLSEHYGLTLSKYSHFTSPIRRMPDLIIHTVISEWLEHGVVDTKRHKEYMEQAAIDTSARESVAVRAERACEGFYKAEYMKPYVGDRFEAVIASIPQGRRGFYVALPNTVEGFVALTGYEDDFDYPGGVEIYCRRTGLTFKMGQEVTVLCSRADVGEGRVYFELA
ncbi:hypothetical protein FACS1894133_3860 [Clostridia bacterium]|nr:hypothetical protein FACS1894133_3860 [Clostridia bacterium]